ncbi:uncharacterized protein LOC129743191 [Uranotaenia lowii]|uniref:uncharacterized protein LOC129743191 n=1 Tax=Uranotaenia lowii TaxID=190385 RepID=UPI00247AE799|nr:uncharacterized protein LOC129743191 [Uranotaenia lowii]
MSLNHIPKVDIQPFVNMLEDQLSYRKPTGTIPKTVKPSFEQWQRETIGVRKVRELQQMHEKESDIRRKREIELTEKLKHLDIQRQAEADRMRKVEADLRQQLQEFREHHEGIYRQRLLDLEKRDDELNQLRRVEKQLRDELDVAHGRQPSLGDSVFNISPRTGNIPPPPSATSPVSTTIPNQNANMNPEFSNVFTAPISSPVGARSQMFFEPQAPSPLNIFPNYTPPIQPTYIQTHPNDFQHPVENNTQFQYGPTPTQMVARHVFAKDLPIFDGNPLDWPLFITSYEQSSNACGFSDSENLLRLQRCLKGKAKEEVHSFLLHPSTVSKVISTLQLTLYGRPTQIVHHMISKIRSTPAPKEDRLDTLVSFGLAVQNMCSHLRAVGMESHMGNTNLLQELVDKLPPVVQFNWALYQHQLPTVDLQSFGQYMEMVTAATSKITLRRDDRVKSKNKAFVNTHTAVNISGDLTEVPNINHPPDTGAEFKSCIACKGKCSSMEKCSRFLNMSLDDRWSLVKERKVCRRCLTPHRRWPCKGEVCGTNNCQKKHHRLLHFEPKAPETTVATVSIHRQERKVETFAFLDDGSAVTLLEDNIARQLGAEGKATSLCIQWTGGVTKTISGTRIVELEIAANSSGIRFPLSKVYTVDCLGLPEQSINYEALSREYSHLRGLPVASFNSAVPGILIGLSNMHLLTTLKAREGGTGEPVAMKSRIGWSVQGCLPGGAESMPHRQMHVCAREEQDLHEYVRQFFEFESLGVTVAPERKSADDLRAQHILESTTKRGTDGRFEVGLLWRYDYVEFPESKPMAEKRFKCLEKRLHQNPALYNSVRQQILAYQQKGYAHQASEAEIQSFDIRRTWYLPLGIVLNDKKPGKVRLIWDAAAKVEGVSLNSMLMKGPDLLTSLLSVLFRYREREVAISGDIREMFHQMTMRKEDRSAQLFLWRDTPDQDIQTMVADVAIFGATCSPAHSQYVKNLNAAEHADRYPKAAAAIMDSHYVDDYLQSVDTPEEAMELVEQVSKVHANGGFQIVNWLSSSKLVLEKLGEVDPASVKALRFDGESGEVVEERLLGMVWQPITDTFSFSLVFRKEVTDLILGEVVPTKRQLLRLVMSIYDPLGMVSNFVIHGKILLQEVWRSKTGWDEQITPENVARFKLWIEFLRKIEMVHIHRCYFPGYRRDSFQSLQLHIFVDANQGCTAEAVIYIPRLELLAAVLGVRIRKTIESEHSLEVKQTFFWSDSSTVLAWIRSDLRKYSLYVGHRINEILESSRIDEWRWVPTRLNVADDATKWGKGPSFEPEGRWFRAPSFLYDEQEEWPKDRAVPETIEEVRSFRINTHVLSEPIVDPTPFSKWERLLRATGYVHCFIDSRKMESKKLTSEHLRKAEQTLWKVAQAEFGEEIAVLNYNKNVTLEKKRKIKKSSPIASYNAFLDEAGVLRVSGRLEAADWLPYDAKYPIILPKNHRITVLLLDWMHRKHHHANNETVTNEIRQRFRIPRLRVQVQFAKKNCMWCRVYTTVPAAPIMGPLPRVRITPFLRPFTYLGIDYFGPYLVKVGRSAVKRWVVLFTCLTIRAIHLEVAATLTSDSCKKAIRRFIARRGAPEEIYTDNGTNFLGVSRELQAEMQKINNELSSTFTDTSTQWHFIPPAAPHMGGCWERMVRSVKAALGSIPTERKLDDESLSTVLAEAEHMVNSRPLTFIPLETENDESLTPNHFLLMSSQGVRQGMKKPVEQAVAFKRSWDTIQYVLQCFWRRWIVEYLPTITRRTKWFEEVRPIKEGELVVIVDEGVRNRWIRGKVLKTHLGKDGIARAADLQTNKGILTRPFTKIALLDVGVHDTDAETTVT